jgi:chemotaxis protein CheD
MNAGDEHFAKHVYFDRHFKCMAARVLPGEYYFTTGDMAILTVLGSCVSACIRDRQTGIGGMNHFMLPNSGGDADSPASASMRYGTQAMEILINQLLKAGAQRANLEAKVFGGGRVLSGMQALNVGERNAAFVKDYLRAERIPVAASDLNDIHPRKVAYFPRTGKVLVKKLESADSKLVQVEQQYSKALQVTPVAGEIELF